MLTSATARRLRAANALLAVAGAISLTFPSWSVAADATWNATNGGSWADAANWLNSVTPPSGSTETAVFATNSSPQTITLDGSRTVHNLIFNSAAGGALTISAGSGASPRLTVTSAAVADTTLQVESGSGDHIISSELRLGGSAGNGHGWQINGSRALTLSGTLSSSAASRIWTKTGTGALILSGRASFSNELTFNLNGGSLVFDFGTNAANSKFDSSGTIYIGGATLMLSGNATLATSQSIGGATITAGLSNILVNSGGQATTLTLSSINRNTAGGVLNLTTGNSANRLTTNSSNTNGIMGGYFTVGLNDWATNVGVPTLAISALPANSYTTATDPSVFDIARNIRLGTGYTGVANAGSINSLKFALAESANLNIAGSSTLAIRSGGILVASTVGANNVGLAGGYLISDNGFDLIVHQHNTGGSLVISSQITNSGGGGNVTGLTKAGAGALVLQGSNSYTGANYIHAGTLRAENANALGTGSVNVGAATLDVAATLVGSNATFGNGATLRGSGVSGYSQISGSNPNVAAGAAVNFIAPTAADTLTLGSALRGGNGGTVTVSGLGTVALASGSAAAGVAFSGAWSVNMGSSGVLRLSDTNALGGSSTPATATVLGGMVVASTGGTIPNAITLAGGALGTTAGNGTFGGNLTLAASTTSKLSLVDPGNGTTARSLNISGPIGGSGNLNIAGSGVATFSAISSYTGTTTISGGTLTLVHASSTNNIANSPSITVQNGANLDVSGIASGFTLGADQTLKGGGTVHGNVSANPSSASRISPGSAGKLTFNGDLTLNTNATYQVQVGGDGVGIGVAGVDFDQVVVNGSGKSLTLGTASLKILPMPGIVIGQPYRIVSATNGASVVSSNIFKNLTQNLNLGGPYSEGNVTYNIAYGYGSGGYVDVTFSTVPEPAGMLLATLGGTLLLRRRRTK